MVLCRSSLSSTDLQWGKRLKKKKMKKEKKRRNERNDCKALNCRSVQGDGPRLLYSLTYASYY